MTETNTTATEYRATNTGEGVTGEGWIGTVRYTTARTILEEGMYDEIYKEKKESGRQHKGRYVTNEPLDVEIYPLFFEAQPNGGNPNCKVMELDGEQILTIDRRGWRASVHLDGDEVRFER